MPEYDLNKPGVHMLIIEDLKTQKRTLIQQRKGLSDKISQLKFREVASVDWAAKSES